METDDRTVLDAFPRAAIDHDNIAFYGGLLERRFLANRCGECGFWHFPPRSICPRCWSRDVVPTEVSGAGVIYMTVALHQGAPPGGEPGVPYPIATVELAEQAGLRVSTMLAGSAPGEMRIGLPVQLGWVDRDGAPYPVFHLVDGGSGS